MYVLFVFCSSETIQVATGNQDDAEIENEPEDEKNIRLGNLTAFGSILKSEQKKGDVGSYFKELQREQQEESFMVPGITQYVLQYFYMYHFVPAQLCFQNTNLVVVILDVLFNARPI